MKTKFIFMLIASGLLFFSCQKNEGAQSAQISTASEPRAAVTTGHAMRTATSLMAIQGTDTGDQTTAVVYSAEMSLGEEVVTGETRRMTWNNNVYDFIEVRRDNGTTGFAFATQVIPSGRLAVVVDENASLSRSDRPVDVSGVILARQAVVVYFPETENNGFVRVRGWDHVRGANISVDNNHVRLAALSTKDSDIQSAIMLQIALSLPDGNARREALLRGALDNFLDSVFFAEIFGIVYPNQTLNSADVFDNFDSDYTETVSVDDDSEDDFFDSKDIDRIQQ